MKAKAASPSRIKVASPLKKKIAVTKKKKPVTSNQDMYYVEDAFKARRKAYFVLETELVLLQYVLPMSMKPDIIN